MNTRCFHRTMRDAFPFGAEYGCAIERPRQGRAANVAAALLLAASFALLFWVGSPVWN